MGIGEMISSAVGDTRDTLFLTAISNLNWSRGYSWYVELDGVPSPFNTGGVIGLPVTDVTLNLGTLREETINTGIQEFKIPIGREVGNIQLTMYDDEQNTLYTFFERWINNIYNPYLGILPLSEAVQKIHIQKLKSTRIPIYRYVTSSSSSKREDLIKDTIGKLNNVYTAKITNVVPKVSPGMNFLVYPTGSLEQTLSSTDQDLMKVTVHLTIAHQLDQDFTGISELNPTAKLGNVSSKILEKVANFI